MTHSPVSVLRETANLVSVSAWEVGGGGGGGATNSDTSFPEYLGLILLLGFSIRCHQTVVTLELHGLCTAWLSFRC